MLNIVIYNSYSRISEPFPEIIDICTLTQEYYFKNKITHRPERKERKRCYFNKNDNVFPTGWLFLKIIPTLKELNIEYQIIDNRQNLNIHNIDVNFPYELRDYQIEAYNKSIQIERGIIAAATGSGKSAIAAKIISYYGLPTLYIVPSLNLINQTTEVFTEFFGGGYVGFIGDGKMNLSLINVATQQTLWSRKNDPTIKSLIERVEVLFLDEAHKIEKPNKFNNYLGNTWYLNAMECENARVRIAMTATPGKVGQYSRELLEAVTGKIIYSVSPSQLIEEGYLAKPTIYVYNIPIKYRLSEWKQAYELNILQNGYRNRIVSELALKYAAEGKRVLIVVDRIEKHGKIFEELIGSSMESMYGNDNSEKRIGIFERFRSGKTKILISTTIKEGCDIPEMDVLILANAGKGGENHRKTVQTIGRCLRKTKDKNTAIIIDFWDKDGGILERHSYKRMQVYKSEEAYTIIKEDYVS